MELRNFTDLEPKLYLDRETPNVVFQVNEKCTIFFYNKVRNIYLNDIFY